MSKTVAKYQQYAEYKDSGVDWLGEIPSHWDFSCLKYALNKVIAGGTPESTNDAYWAESGFGIPWVSIADITKSFEIIKTKRDVTEVGLAVKNLQILPKGTILYSIFASLGKVSIARVPLVTNQAILGLIPEDSKLDSKYLVYWLQAIEGNLGFFSTSNTQDNLNAEKVGNLPLFNPPLNEQCQIANFLDHETTQIDSLIEKQQLLIELLKEKRQAVISHAVTKGLNPNVPMKDSGVEWLGQVPEHWTVSKLKYFVNVVDCKHITAEFFDEGIPLASIGEVKGWKVNLLNAKLTNEKHYQELIDGNRTPQVGDIIYTRNATVGEASLVHSDLPKFALGQDVCLIHIIQKLLPEFLLHFLKSEIIKIQLNSAMVGSTFKRINVDDIRNYLIVIPPAEEQESILKDLSKKIEKYDLLIDFAVQQIKLMQERRTALISSAVTGKIDVRNWQNPTEAKMEFSA